MFSVALLDRKKVAEIPNLGENIRQARKSIGFTQERLAELSGLSVNFISRIERTSDQNISINFLYKIANALHVDPADLLHDTYQSPKSIHPNIDKLSLALSKMENERGNQIAKELLKLLNIMK